MYIANVTNDYDNMTDYDIITCANMTLSNCTNTENNIEIIIPLFTKIPCGHSFFCLKSLLVYTLIKPLINNKWWRKLFTQLNQFVVS